jgi:hypothetical protein
MVDIIKTSDLEAKNAAELREICKKYNIVGMSKARKDVMVSAIEAYYKEVDPKAPKTSSATKAAPAENTSKLPFINANLHSFLESNNSYKTLVSVSCGASSSNYPVVGRSVGFVKATYREILNVDNTAKGVVNGDEIADSYILKSGDVLEFVRKAGTKG